MAGINNYSNAMYGKTRKQFYLEDTDEPDDNGLRSRSSFKTGTTHFGPSRLSPPHSQLPYNMDERHQAYFGSMNSMDNAGGIRYVNSDRDFSLPLEKHKGLDNFYDSENDGEFAERNAGSLSEASVRRYLGIGVQWVSLLTENLLSHPFIVLRRQCQVYNASEYYHLHPLYLIPSIVNLQRRQGFTTMWKGISSCLLVRGLSMTIEDLLSKVTGWPKEVNNRTNLRRFGQHVLLKCISIVSVIPYYSASLVETVQSDIASEKPGLFDVFREGSLRLLYWKYPHKGRMLPVWALIGPCITIGVTKYLFGLVMKGISTRITRRRLQKAQEAKGAKYKDDSLEHQNAEAYANLISMLTTELIFYPFETILHRIQLQGTRTIIDNLDNGYAVVPILTNYQGAFDCYRTTLSTEGVSGLYKGFGALILQFAAHVAVIKLTRWVVTQISEVVASRPPAKVVQYYNLDRAIAASDSTTISPSISPQDSDLNIPTAQHTDAVVEASASASAAPTATEATSASAVQSPSAS